MKKNSPFVPGSGSEAVTVSTGVLAAVPSTSVTLYNDWAKRGALRLMSCRFTTSVIELLRGGMPPSDAVTTNTSVVACSRISDRATTMLPSGSRANRPTGPWVTLRLRVTTPFRPGSVSVAVATNKTVPVLALFCNDSDTSSRAKYGTWRL